MTDDGTLRLRMVPDGTGFQERVQAQTRRVRANVNVGLDADARAFEQRLRAQTSRMNPTVHVRLDYDRGQLDRLEGAMRGLTDTIGQLGTEGGAGMGGLSTGAMGATRSMRGLGGAAQLAGVAVLGLAAINLVPLIASASEALGVFTLLPAAITGAGASLATLVIGSQGIVDAFSAASDAAQTAGEDAEAMARAQRDAAEQVVRAQEGVADAYKAQADAQRDTRRAAEDLNDVYKQQARDLRDINNQLQDSILATEDAAIGVARAKQQYARTLIERRTGRADNLDLQEADLRVRQALSRYNQQRQQTADLRQDTREANREGVEGSDEVVAAKERLAAAQRNELMASRQIRDASIALRNAYEAQRDAAKGAGTAADAYAKALANLSPWARDFVEKIRGLSGAWKALRMEVQDNLFEGLGDDIVRLANRYLPILQEGLSGIASAFNGGLRRIVDMMDNDRVASQWAAIFARIGEALNGFMGGMGHLGRALTTITEVGSRFLPKMGEGFENSMKRFADWIDEIADNGKLERFIQKAIDKFNELWHIGGQIVELIGNIFSGGKETGDDMLKSISDVLEDWNEFLGSEEGQRKLHDFFQDVKDITADILDSLEAAGKLIGPLTTAMGILTNLTGGDEPGPKEKGGLLSHLPVIGDMSGQQINGLEQVPGIGPLLQQLQLLPGVWDGVGKAFSSLADTIGSTFNDRILPKLVEFRSWLEGLPGTASDKLSQVGGWFGTLGDTVRTKVSEMVGNLGSLVGEVESLPDRIRSATSGTMFQPIADAFANAMDWIIQKWNSLKMSITIPEIKWGPKTILQKREITLAVPQIGDSGQMRGQAGTFALPGGPPVAPVTPAAPSSPDPQQVPSNTRQEDVGGLGARARRQFGRADGGLVASRDGSGILSGPGGPRDDAILAFANGAPAVWVANQERVMSVASRAGGNDRLQEAMNAGWVLPIDRLNAVLDLPRRADGGTIDLQPNDWYTTPPSGYYGGATQPGGGSVALGNISGEGITTPIQQSMWDTIRSVFPDAVLSSATRTVQTEGHADYHNAGKALDLTGPMDEMARWIYALNGTQQVAELIHWPLNGWENLKDGAPLDYGSGTNSGHMDHVHWAMLAPIGNATSVGAGMPGGQAPPDLTVGPVDQYGANTGYYEGAQVPQAWNPNTTMQSPDTIAYGTYGPGAGYGATAGYDSFDPTSASSWSQLFGEAAQAGVSGYVQDTLGVFGINDTLPGVVQAGQIAYSGAIAQGLIQTPNANGSTNAPGVVQFDGGYGQDNQPSYPYTTQGYQDVPAQVIPGDPNASTQWPGTIAGPSSLGSLTPQSDQAAVAAAIISEGRNRGYSDAEIQAILATGIQESNLDPQAIGGGGAWHGVFQQDSSYPGRDDPNQNIKAFYDRLDAKRVSPGWSDDPYKNIFWLQQAPAYDSAEAAYANGRRGYYDEIRGRQGEAMAFMGAQLYDSGGKLKPGVTVAVNKTGQDEYISTQDGLDGAVSDVLGGVNQMVSDASASALVSAASAVPNVGPALASAVQTGVNTMRSVNQVVERGVGVYEGLRGQAGSMLGSTAPQGPMPQPQQAPQEVHFHGKDWREALERKRIADAQARAYEGPRR